THACPVAVDLPHRTTLIGAHPADTHMPCPTTMPARPAVIMIQTQIGLTPVSPVPIAIGKSSRAGHRTDSLITRRHPMDLRRTDVPTCSTVVHIAPKTDTRPVAIHHPVRTTGAAQPQAAHLSGPTHHPAPAAVVVIDQQIGL